jgi:signal transduction histidine kinase
MSKELSKALTINTPFCVQTWQEINGELRLIGFNPTLEGYTKGKIKDYTGCTVHDLYAARGRNDVVDLIYETYRKKGMLRIETFCDFLIPGNERFVDTVSFFVTPNILVQYIEDVTEQRQALAALKESEERFRALFLGSPVPVMTWRNTNGEFILDEYNLAMNKFTSGKISDLLGAGAKQLFSANPEICEDIQVCFNENKIVQRQTMVMFSGDERHLSITHAYVPNNLVLTHIHDITDQKRAEDELLRYQKELSNLYEKHLNVLEHERQRISQELHDGIGQYLSTIKVSTENLLLSNAEKMDRQSMEEQLRANIALLKEAIMDVSKVSMDLRPSILDDLGLIATINWFLREFGKVYRNIEIEKQITLEDPEIPQNIKIVIFRVLQEAMNNIAKHSRADCIHISMHKTKEAIEFIIKDNGVGFDVSRMQKNRCGLGIASMRERVAFSQGKFSIESEEGSGTALRFEWPLNG